MGSPDALIVVPPFIKYAAGPLLGPGLLQSAANAAGFSAETADLNIMLMHTSGILPPQGLGANAFIGDHSKPGGFLRRVEQWYWRQIREGLDSGGVSFSSLEDRIRSMAISHETTDRMVDRISATPFGEHLCSLLCEKPQRGLLGVSVMWSAQVIPALIISRWSKLHWPGTWVVWGGPHVTALSERIARDSRYGRWVDGFLPQHCEGSFTLLMESIRDGGLHAPGLIFGGQGVPLEPPLAPQVPPVPEFPNLSLYGRPRLVLPAQLSRGCAYGRCAFCTYPAIEGKYTPLGVDHLEPLVQMAIKERGSLSLKDSLVTTERLIRIAELVRGRIVWSACTKLHPSLGHELLAKLAEGGCRTLEVGLETLHPDTQRVIDKHQSPRWLHDFLQGAEEAGISAVVNYITGFPREDPRTARSLLDWLRHYVRTFPDLDVRVEHNRFSLERLSPMARYPDIYGIKVTGEWPWSSVLSWRPL